MKVFGIAHWLRSASTLAVCSALGCALNALAADRPNIVYIIADDLGWNDVGFHGSAIRTPNLDRLAAAGAILNSFYVQPFSTQTRAALMTGRYPMRYGLQTASIMPSSTFGLPERERTLGQALKDSGYATAFIGKWQLGHSRPDYWPTRRGFDYFYGSLSGHIGYALDGDAGADWYRGERKLKERGLVTSLLGKNAAALIDRHKPDRPLLLMLSFSAPSAPYGAPQELVDRYREIGNHARRRYAAAVTVLDIAVGDVLSALERNKMMENTLIVFHSDNGGALPTKFATGDADVQDLAADNGIFREGRGSLYEGGVRAAAFAFWPAKIKPGIIVTDLLHVSDVYATLVKLAGGSTEQPEKLDGMDQWPTLSAGRPGPRKEVLINVEDFRGAIRVGEWKLVVHAALPSTLELFDIANDPEEARNLADRNSERVSQMLAKLNDYAYEMAPAAYLEELATARSGHTPIFWRYNPVRR